MLEAVIAELDRRWQRLDAARAQAAKARILLKHDGPRQTVLTARMTAAVGRLSEIEPARLTAPGQEPVTVADLEAARQALAGPAQAIDDVAQNLEDVAADTFATAAERWQRHEERGIAREEHAQRLLPGLGAQGPACSALSTSSAPPVARSWRL